MNVPLIVNFFTTLSFIATCMNYIWSDTRFIRKSLWSHSQALVCGHESLGTRLGVHHLTKDLLQAYNARRCANPNLGWSFAHSKILSWSFTQVYLGKPLILIGQDQNYHVQCIMCHSNKQQLYIYTLEQLFLMFSGFNMAFQDTYESHCRWLLMTVHVSHVIQCSIESKSA